MTNQEYKESLNKIEIERNKKVRELKVGTNEIFDSPEKNKRLNKFIGSQARRYLNEQINGDLIILYKKEFKIGGFNDK